MHRVPGGSFLAMGIGLLLILSACGGGGGSSSGGGGGAPPTQGPTVVSVTPANGTSNAALSTPITATFSKEMDPSTINDTTVRIQTGGAEVNGALSYGTAYQVTISKEVRDLSGTPMDQDYTWQFTTLEAPAGSLAGVLSLDGNLGISYDNATRTAAVSLSSILSLEGISVTAVQTNGDYTTVSAEASTTTSAPGTFAYSTLADGRYFLNSEFSVSNPGGSDNQFLALGTVSLLGSAKVVSLEVRDVTPTAEANRLDLYCKECHPLVQAEPGQIVSCSSHSYAIPDTMSPAPGVLDAYERITCRSCHTAHVPTGVLHFCILPYDNGLATLCLQCH